MQDDLKPGWDEELHFGGCSCLHDPGEHGWGACTAEGCGCEGGWEE